MVASNLWDGWANAAKGNPQYKAETWTPEAGDLVYEKAQAKSSPRDIWIYTVIEARPDAGKNYYLCASVDTGAETFWDLGEMAPWTQAARQKMNEANEKHFRNPPKTPNWTRPNPDRPKTAPAQATKTIPIHAPDRPQINAAGRFLTFTVMGTFTVLSQQVWMHYSDTLLRQINRIPFLGLIIQIPMVGGVIEFFGPWFPDLFGVGVWALINACQSGKDIIKLLDIRDPWWVAMLTDWSRPQYVAAAYIAEIVLNYDKFPLFKGGIDYLIANGDSLDMDLFIWPNVFYLLISVLSFEHLVKFFTPRSVRGKRGTTRNPQSI